MVGLKALEDDCIRMRGRPAHPREIFNYLETVRERSEAKSAISLRRGRD